MKCNQVEEKLIHSIDKELSPQIREHLLGCEECERKYRILQETEKSLEDFGRAVRDGSISMEGTAISTGSTPFRVDRNTR